MNSKLKKKDLNFRKLKISDFKKFKKLFYLTFKKNISYDFFKWRYFSDNFSLCYGVFISSDLIANVSLVSIKLNKTKNKRIYSRHSSMVLKKYRGIGIFSRLLKNLKKKISKKVDFIIMWPNEQNFANFDIKKNKIIKKKYYLYKTFSKNITLGETKNYSIFELYKFKNFIKGNRNLFIKDFEYFKKRYLSYKSNEYFINKYQYKNLNSFFILKRNKEKSELNYVILDHFGSTKINLKHLNYLVKSQNKLIFLSKKKINKTNHKLINFVNIKIGFLKKINIKQKKDFFDNKEIYLGDTDIFITI